MTLPEHKDIILNSLTQIRENWDFLVFSRAEFCMVGWCHGIPCFHFYFFLFRSIDKKEHLNDNYEAHWQRHLKNTLQLKILRIWINVHADSFLDKYHEIKMGEGAVEIISCTKIGVCLWRTLHQDILLIIVLFFASQTNLVFKFNRVLTQFVYCYLWILCVSWSSSSASTLFYSKPVKFRWS